MKVCENCGIEIYTRDGENECRQCDGADIKTRRAQRQKMQRKARHEAMLSLGLKRVRGALGGTYYE